MELAMTRSQLRSRILASVTGAAALLSGSAFGGELRLDMDQAYLITTKAPFKTVSVGNSLIADVTAVDDPHLLIFAKQFGTTNLIAIDGKGKPITEEQITVTTQRGQIVTLQRGARWSTLTCTTERCDIRPTPGDDPLRFQQESGQITAREGANTTAASPR